MEWTLNLGGNVPERAAEGAAALRQEGSAAKETTSALAGLDEASKRGAALASSIASAKREMSLLKAARDSLASGGDAVDVEAYRSLTSQIDKAKASAASASESLAKMGMAGRDFKAELAATKAQQREEEKLRKEKESAAAQGSKAAKDTIASTKATTSELSKLAQGALLAGAAYAGLNSLGDLTKMAIGWRTMGQLQLVSYRATMDLRRAVAGVDAQPLVRAAERLEKNLSKSTVTGNALSGILTRGFDGAFRVVEKLEPMAEAFFQGALIGALELELGILKLEERFAPLVVAVENWVTSEDGMQTAAYAGAAALAAVGVSAAIATAPVLATAAAFVSVGNAIRAAIDLKKQWDGAAVWKKVKADATDATLGMMGMGNGQGGRDQDAQDRGRAAFEANQARFATARAASDGRSTGNDIGQGIVKGLDETASDVKAAGGRAADAAIQGARTKAEAHSPAESTARLGRDLDAGVVKGLGQGADAVQAAGEKALVPDVSGSGGGGSGGGGFSIQNLIGQLIIQAKGGDADAIAEALSEKAPEILQMALRALMPRIGIVNA